MPKFSQKKPPDGEPTTAEIFRVFRNTVMASIKGLSLLLGECADLRADLVTVHSLHTHGESDVFSAHQRSCILKLRMAAKELETLLSSLPRQQPDRATDASNEV